MYCGTPGQRRCLWNACNTGCVTKPHSPASNEPVCAPAFCGRPLNSTSSRGSQGAATQSLGASSASHKTTDVRGKRLSAGTVKGHGDSQLHCIAPHEHLQSSPALPQRQRTATPISCHLAHPPGPNISSIRSFTYIVSTNAWPPGCACTHFHSLRTPQRSPQLSLCPTTSS